MRIWARRKGNGSRKSISMWNTVKRRGRWQICGGKQTRLEKQAGKNNDTAMKSLQIRRERYREQLGDNFGQETETNEGHPGRSCGGDKTEAGVQQQD